MNHDDLLRTHLQRLLDWQDAHVNFDAAVEGIPPELRGRQPEGLPYSPWQLLEHMRIAQHDILEFCRNPKHPELSWPSDYWPRNAARPSTSAWDDSIRRFQEDRDALQRLARDPATQLE